MSGNCRVSLYRRIDALRRLWNVRDPFDPFLAAESLPGIRLYETAFSTAGLHGFIVTSPDKSRATIVLDTRRSEEEQMFDLSHELIHFALHPPTDRVHGYSPFMEWQANEGAAELLLPRTLLLRILSETRDRIRASADAALLVRSLARRQGIRETVVRWRMWSLRLDVARTLAGENPETLPLLPQRAYPPLPDGPANWFFPTGQKPLFMV